MAVRDRRRQHAVMVATIDAWRCIGCGKLTAEHPCIGVCQDRRVELVEAAEVAELASKLERAEAVLALIARVTPHPDQLAESWAVLQQRARAALAG